MTKTQLARKVAESCGMSQTKAIEVVSTIFDTRPGFGIIADELDAGRHVVLQGFGTFTIKRRAPRTGRNPATGVAVPVPAREIPFFRAGKNLKERVSQ